MKKNILYIALACFALGFTSCSDDPNDACDKHVYSEDETPCLRVDQDATIAINTEFREGRISPMTINLKDYAETIQTKMGMTVDDMIAGLETGKVVFYNIASSKGAWDKTPTTKGTTCWYYSSNGLLKDSVGYINEKNQAASIEVDKTNKTLIISVPKKTAAGLAIAENVGFAVNNGKNYDNYVRFNISISVTNPGLIILNETIPTGDYSTFTVDFSKYQDVIEKNMGMTLSEFIKDCKDATGPIAMYMVDNTTGEWNTSAKYTANNLGYWLDGDSHVTTWNTAGYTMFIETKDDGTVVNIGRAPSIASGTKKELNFVYVVKNDQSKYFQFKINVEFK